MMHSGYEATAVDYTFSFRGIFATVRSMLFSRYPDAEALAQVAGEKPQPLLVQIESVNRPSLQGVTVRTDENLEQGIDDAFDYRGDLTITLKNGQSFAGYVFDRDHYTLRMIASDQRRHTISSEEIETIAFSGRDMADGRSWEAWVGKYAEKRAAGETNIELVPEAID
jgi:hypothetical protein